MLKIRIFNDASRTSLIILVLLFLSAHSQWWVPIRECENINILLNKQRYSAIKGKQNADVCFQEDRKRRSQQNLYKYEICVFLLGSVYVLIRYIASKFYGITSTHFLINSWRFRPTEITRVYFERCQRFLYYFLHHVKLTKDQDKWMLKHYRNDKDNKVLMTMVIIKLAPQYIWTTIISEERGTYFCSRRHLAINKYIFRGCLNCIQLFSTSKTK